MMAPSKSPQLGSLALQAPTLNPKVVNVTPSTCSDLSLFKDLLREYRKLDDMITIRLNRSTAQYRDQDRLGLGKGNVDEQACLQVWRELMANWKRRTDIVGYCVEVVDISLVERRQAIHEESDPAAQRRYQGVLYAEEVKRNQVHNELAVEKIVRKRSLDAFRSRCKYFEPPTSDSESREWWEAARAGR